MQEAFLKFQEILDSISQKFDESCEKTYTVSNPLSVLFGLSKDFEVRIIVKSKERAQFHIRFAVR